VQFGAEERHAIIDPAAQAEAGLAVAGSEAVADLVGLGPLDHVEADIIRKFLGDLAEVAEIGEVPQNPRQGIVAFEIDRAVGQGAARIGRHQVAQRAGEQLHVAVRLHVDVGLGGVFVAEKVQADGHSQRDGEEGRPRDTRRPESGGGHRGAEKKKPRPDHRRQAPRCFVRHERIGQQDAAGEDGEQARCGRRGPSVAQRPDQPGQRRPFVAREQRDPVVVDERQEIVGLFGMALAFRPGFGPHHERGQWLGQTAPVEKVSRVEKDKQEDRDRAGRPGIAARPSAHGSARDRRAHGRDLLPEREDARRQSQRDGVDEVGLLVEEHAGKTEHRGPQPGAVALQPEGDGTPGEKHGEEDKPRLVDRIAPVEHADRRHGEGQRSPPDGPASEPAGEEKENRDARHAGQHDRQAQRPEVAPEQFLREKDGVEMPRPVEIGRIVVEKPVLAQAIGEPAVDALVEMRRAEIEQEDTQHRGHHHDGEEIPRKSAHGRGQGHGDRAP